MSGRSPAAATFDFRAARALMAAVSLGVFDALAEGARSAVEVAGACRLAPRGAEALLAALAAQGLVAREGERFRATREALAHFATDGARSRAHVVRHDLWHQGLWARLEESVTSGLPLADRSKDPFFTDPDVLRRFFPNLAEAMVETSRDESSLFAERLSLAPGACVLDVGGGAGSWSIALARAHASARVVLLELPPMAAEAERTVKEAGLEGRVRVAAGDALAGAWPEGAPRFDRVLLARVLMGLDDERAARLLVRAREALAPAGRVDVCEFRRGEGVAERVAALLDLDMLLVTGGALRDDARLTALFERAGLRVVSRRPLGALLAHWELTA